MPGVKPSVLVPLAAVCALLAGCGDSGQDAGSAASSAMAALSSAASRAASATATASTSSGSAGCADRAVASSFLIDTQAVYGLANTPLDQWSSMPLGHVDQFGGEVTALSTLTGVDEDLAYFKKAADIVAAGLGGSATAPADLKAAMGADASTMIGHQSKILQAYAAQCSG